MATIQEFSELVNARMKASKITSKSLVEHIGKEKWGITIAALDNLRRGKLRGFPRWSERVAFHLEIDKNMIEYE